MTRVRVVLSIGPELLRQVDQWITACDFTDRAQAVESAISRLRQRRASHAAFLRKLNKLDPKEERALAEEWFVDEMVPRRDESTNW